MEFGQSRGSVETPEAGVGWSRGLRVIMCVYACIWSREVKRLMRSKSVVTLTENV